MIVDVFYFHNRYLAEVALMGLLQEPDRFMEIMREGGYYPVARFNLDDFPDAFRATNHVTDEPWWVEGENNGTLLRLARPGEFRSSMGGDIFATEKGAYLLKSIGFERLPDEASVLLNQLWEFA